LGFNLQTEMKVALVAIVKQEQHLVEWCRYHYALGFDKIFFFANDWMPDYALPNSVDVTPIAGECQQINAYNRWITTYGSSYDYVAFFDADEYLYLVKHKSVKEFIADYKTSISINWVFFGSNETEIKQGIVGRFIHRQVGVDRHTKMIVKLTSGVRMINPHFANEASYSTERLPLIRNPFNERGTDQIAFIAHYWTQTREYFESAKVARGRADTGLKFNLP